MLKFYFKVFKASLFLNLVVYLFLFGMMIDAGPKFYVIRSPTLSITKVKVTDSNFCSEIFTMSVFAKPLMD